MISTQKGDAANALAAIGELHGKLTVFEGQSFSVDKDLGEQNLRLTSSKDPLIGFAKRKSRLLINEINIGFSDHLLRGRLQCAGHSRIAINEMKVGVLDVHVGIRTGKHRPHQS